jgi:hypothetical protein
LLNKNLTPNKSQISLSNQLLDLKKLDKDKTGVKISVDIFTNKREK